MGADEGNMRRPPRPKDEPIMSRSVLTRYSITGLYVGIATIGAFAEWYVRHGVEWAALRDWTACSRWSGFAPTDVPGFPGIKAEPCSIFTSGGRAAQTVALSTLVLMESLKALSA